MKTVSLIIVLSSSFLSSAQTSSCDYLEKAIEYFGNEELDSAINLMVLAIETTPDTNQCYGRCFNNIPLAYAMQEKFDKSKEWFGKIMESELDDFEPGDDIMEPYANYHHNACMQMVKVHDHLEEYPEGLRYLNLAESRYRFECFSGTSFEKRAVSIAKWKGALYMKMNLPDSSLFVQLNKILDTDIRYRKSDFTSLSSIAFYPSLIENVEKLIGKEALNSEKKKLQKSIKMMEITTSGEMRKGSFQFRGLNYTIGISSSAESEKEVVARLLDSAFFD
jgi:tetratricopeptide (TPR) repeat protein